MFVKSFANGISFNSITEDQLENNFKRALELTDNSVDANFLSTDPFAILEKKFPNFPEEYKDYVHIAHEDKTKNIGKVGFFIYGDTQDLTLVGELISYDREQITVNPGDNLSIDLLILDTGIVSKIPNTLLSSDELESYVPGDVVVWVEDSPQGLVAVAITPLNRVKY